MKFDKMTKGRVWAGALILLLGTGLLLMGCESDSVAPDEELPALTGEEAAQQAALVAVGVAKVGPELVKFDGSKASPAEDGVYPYTFPQGSNVTGSIVLEFFSGGPTGSHVVWDMADYGKLYTPNGEMVTVSVDLGEIDPIYSVAFELYGPIDRAADTATVSGTGTFISGDRTTPFTLTDVLLEDVSTYPDGGTVVLAGEGIEATVTYDGTRYATVAITDGDTFSLDLDTGIITVVT